MTIRGTITAARNLPVTDCQGDVARVGLRIRDFATGEILSETRGELAQEGDAIEGLTFQATLHGYGLRPEANRLSAGLVIDPIAWYSHTSESTLSLMPSPEFIDVRTLMRSLSVEELCGTANSYFEQLRDNPWLSTKPFELGEAQALLPEFAFLIRGLRLSKGMRVMDFGAGTGWASRWLWQLGLQVFSTDVSAVALNISASLAKQTPTFAELHPIEYLLFNGHRFDLPDASIDRVFCMAALHHVSNVEQVFAEFARIISDGGRIGFAEPGPRHSLYSLSQHEMRNNTVVENDVNLEEIQRIAQSVGFGPVEVMIQNTLPTTTTLDKFMQMGSSSELQAVIVQEIRERAKFSQIFFFNRLPR